jgi:SNF2 family DNA or RNA helicase
MELHINIAAETVALSRIVRTRGRIMEVKKLVMTDTVEENIVNFQNALIRGDAKLKQDSSLSRLTRLELQSFYGA